MGTAPDAPAPRQATPTEVKVLLWFLAGFVAILIVFHGVLFPFLMAMFLAYLIEPVVAWVNRGKHLGIRWGRGPVLILMYSVVLFGLFSLVSCAVSRIDATVRNLRGSLATELEKTAEKAVFVLAEAAPAPIVVPQGTEVVYDPPARPRKDDPAREDDPAPGVYRTTYAAILEKGETRTTVLLDPGPKPAPPDAVMGLADPARLKLPPGVTLKVERGEIAKGLEVFVEHHVIGPVAVQIQKATGAPVDPGWLRRMIQDESERQGTDIGKRVFDWTRGLLFTVVGSTYQLILILMLTAFIVVDRRRIAEFFASLPPPHRRAQYQTLMGYVDRGLAGVIRGQIVICLVNGVLTYVGLVIYGIRYAEILACVAGVFSLIPVFGTIASSIPIVLVALAGGGLSAGLFALAWISLIHLLEANLFNPLIMGTSAEMHPVVIIFALLAGEHSFGVWGALLAVPTASIIQSCFKYWRHEVLGMPVGEYHGHGKWLRNLLARKRQAAAAPEGGGGS